MLVGTVEFTLFVLLTVILAGPMMAERFRIPGLLGLIFFGMIFGPFMLGWLGRVGLVEDLGKVGIIYLMFLAGLSFNLKAFLASRSSAVAFGLLGFGVPFFLSVWVGVSLLDLGVMAALLVGAMWASNTLVAYPDARAAGLADNRAVVSAVSAGVVADMLSLLVLAVATSTAFIEVSPFDDGGAEVVTGAESPLPLWLAIPLLIGFTLWLLPRVGTWFFVKVGHSRTQRFLFSLVVMAAGASMAVAAGVEGIIGAFLAGLGLNRLVPAGSELMSRIDFVGSTVFVPAFLVSIGLSIDPSAFFDLETVRLGMIFTGLVLVGKTIAAAIGGPIYRYSFNEIGLMASLSYGQAASTLAIAQVGLSLGFFDQEVVNGAVFAIVVTALATATLTQVFIRRMPRPEHPPAAVGERIVIDAAHSLSNLKTVMDLAGRVAISDGGVLIPFTVQTDPPIEAARARISEADEAAASAGHDTTGLVRVSESFMTGALELVAENDATLAVLNWSRPKFGSSYVFGSQLDAFGARSPIPTMAVQLQAPWSRVVLVLGDTKVQWHHEDATLAADLAGRLVTGNENPLLVFARREDEITSSLSELEGVEVRIGRTNAQELLRSLQADDLLVIPAHVIQDTPLPDRLRFANNVGRTGVAIVAGPNRMTLSRVESDRMERLIGHGR